jgi:MFS transporter, UMF1 family
MIARIRGRPAAQPPVPTDREAPMSSRFATAAPPAAPGANPNLRPRTQAAWTLYDFGNTIYSFAIVSGAIGLWLTDPSQFGPSTGQLMLSVAIALSVGINAIVSPVLGALSDRGGRRLPFLLVFTIMCIVPTAVIDIDGPVLGLVLFVFANFSYQAALIYYDASLKLVSTPNTRGRLSGIGIGVAYCGSITVGLLIFLFSIPVEARFVLAAAMYALFAVPVFVFVKEPAPTTGRLTAAEVVASWKQLSVTFRHAQEVPGLLRFLVGRFFYSDALNTVVVVMSIVAVDAVGLSTKMANVVLILLTVVAIVMAVVWGRLNDRWGPRRTLTVVLITWAVGLVIAVISLSLNGTDPLTGGPVPTPPGLALFLVAGAIIGSGLGGIHVSDRVFMIRLSPPARLGEFFGLYGLAGKGSQVVGQLLYGAIVFALLDTLHVGAYQVAILSLIVTMLIGLWLIWPVSDRWAGSGELPGDAGSGSAAA